MKKKLTLIMALCIALCGLAGCSGNAAEAQTTTTASETTTTTAAAKTETNTTTTATEKEETPAAEGTVIYDANDIKITATEFTKSKEYFDERVLALDIVNNTGKELAFWNLPTSIGGWMERIEPMTVSEDGFFDLGSNFTIPAENDTNKYYMCVVDSILKRYGFDEIPDIELGFEIHVGEDFENTFVTGLVDVVNPAYTGGSPEIDESGDVVYDKDGVKIVMQGETYDADYWGPKINMYASNSTDKAVHIHIPETTLDGTAFNTYGDMEIAPGKRVSEEVLFGFIDDFAKSMTEVEPVSEVTMKFDIYETDFVGEETLLDSSEPVTVTYDASTVEKTSVYYDNYEEEHLSDEELAELKGWWTREGDFTDNDTVRASVSFFTLGEYTWYLNGSFGDNYYWGGRAVLSDEGLSGTMETALYDDTGDYSEGDPIDVKVTEDGDDGILLTLGTGEEYHLVPVTY